jgi:hypothetical protein
MPSWLITLVVIVVFVIVMFYWLSSTANYGHLCSPSSCGEIHNISYLFGLKGERQFNLKSGKGKPKESFERKVKGSNTFLSIWVLKILFFGIDWISICIADGT